jgi:Ring finger domain
MTEQTVEVDTNDQESTDVVPGVTSHSVLMDAEPNNDPEPDIEEQRFSLPQEWSASTTVAPFDQTPRSPIFSPTEFPPLRPINPDEIVDSLEDSDGEESHHSPEDDPDNPSRYNRRRSCVYWTTRLLCFPVWLLITVTTVSTVFAFCIIPGILLIALIITFYYCCSRDPIPLDVLLQALFFDEETENNPNNAPPCSKEEIRSLLLCRTCLDIQPRHSDGDSTNVEPPDHTAILAEAPLSFPTEHYVLTFSGPMIPSVPPTDPWTATRNFYLHMHDDDYDDPAASSIGAVRTRSGDSQDDEVAMIEMTSLAEEALAPSRRDPLAVAEAESKVEDTAADPVSVNNHRIEEENDDDDEEYESGMGCDICLRRYACHDVVAWSRNTDCCIHAYHVDCITDWLQKKPTCPNCRGIYIPLRSSSSKRGARPTNGTGRTAAERNV